MGSRCDYRVQARSIANSARQRAVVEELLSGRGVPMIAGADGTQRVGLSGLGLLYFDDLRLRLMEAGFGVHAEHRTMSNSEVRVFYRLTFPIGG